VSKRPIIATYYFPNWHTDPRIEELHGKGWTEWRVAQYATPRFDGHQQLTCSTNGGLLRPRLTPPVV